MRLGVGKKENYQGFQEGPPPTPAAPPYPGPVFNFVDPELHGHVKAVQDVPSKHQGVYGRVDRMDPTWRGGKVDRG